MAPAPHAYSRARWLVCRYGRCGSAASSPCGGLCAAHHGYAPLGFPALVRFPEKIFTEVQSVWRCITTIACSACAVSGSRALAVIGRACSGNDLQQLLQR